MKEFKADKNKWKTSHVHKLKELIQLKCHSSQSYVQIHAISIKIPITFFLHNQWRLILGMKGCFNIPKPVNLNDHINNLKEKSIGFKKRNPVFKAVPQTIVWWNVYCYIATMWPIVIKKADLVGKISCHEVQEKHLKKI